MASLPSLDFEDGEAECEGQLEFSFHPGGWSSQPSPWDTVGTGGIFLLASNHVCPQKRTPESNHLRSILGFRILKQLF